MAPRSSWKGYLRLSLVTCSVRLYPATSSSSRISFNQLHKVTRNRINMKPVDPKLGLVDRSELVRGYEYESKKYVIIEDSDLEAVKVESIHTLNIEAFVETAEVGAIYLDAPYYLVPDGAMAEALIEQKTVAFDPKLYEDRYEAAVLDMIRKKLKGHQPVVAAEPERNNVVDLMQALKASLADQEPPANSQRKSSSRAPKQESDAKPASRSAGGRAKAG
jgi:non-homologous end joining protein Ku